MICPKCNYERQPTDITPEYECPSCGVIYAKVTMARAGVRTFTPLRTPDFTQQFSAEPSQVEAVVVDVRIPFETMFRLCLQFSLAAIPAILLAALAIYGAVFAFGGLGATWGIRSRADITRLRSERRSSTHLLRCLG